MYVPSTRSNSATGTPRVDPGGWPAWAQPPPSVPQPSARAPAAAIRSELVSSTSRCCLVSCKSTLPVLVGSAPADCRVRLRSAVHCETGPAGWRTASSEWGTGRGGHRLPCAGPPSVRSGSVCTSDQCCGKDRTVSSRQLRRLTIAPRRGEGRALCFVPAEVPGPQASVSSQPRCPAPIYPFSENRVVSGRVSGNGGK